MAQVLWAPQDGLKLPELATDRRRGHSRVARGADERRPSGRRREANRRGVPRRLHAQGQARRRQGRAGGRRHGGGVEPTPSGDVSNCGSGSPPSRPPDVGSRTSAPAAIRPSGTKTNWPRTLTPPEPRPRRYADLLARSATSRKRPPARPKRATARRDAWWTKFSRSAAELRQAEAESDRLEVEAPLQQKEVDQRAEEAELARAVARRDSPPSARGRRGQANGQIARPGSSRTGGSWPRPSG